MGRRAKRRRFVESDLATDTKWEEEGEITWYEPISEALFAMDRVTRQLRHPQRTEENVKDAKLLLPRRHQAATTKAVDDTVTVAVEVDDVDQPTMTISLPSAPSVLSFLSEFAAPDVPAAPTTPLPAAPSVPQVSTTIVEMTSATGSLTQAYLSPLLTPLPEVTDTNNSTSTPTGITSLSSYVTFSVPSNSTIRKFTYTSAVTSSANTHPVTSLSPSGTGMPNNSLIASNSSTNATSGLPTTLYSSSSLLNATTTPSPSTLSTSTISGSSS